MENLISSTTLLPNTSTPTGKQILQCHHLNLSSRSKIFEISNICDIAKVCLAYESPESTVPKIYLLETQTLKWQFLADTFTEYQRMSIAHLGLPYWELCFSTCGLPSWTEQLFLLLAPHLLEKNEPRRNRTLPMISKTTSVAAINPLDATIFRTKQKGTKSNVVVFNGGAIGNRSSNNK